MILEGYVGRRFDTIIANHSVQDWSALADDISVKSGTPFIIDQKLVSLLEARGTTLIQADLLDTNHLTYRYDIQKLAQVLRTVLG